MDNERLAALEAHYNAMAATFATKADVESLRADIHKWMVASLIGLFVGFGGLAAALGQMLKPLQPAAPVVVQSPPAQSAQPTQPIVIYLPAPQK